MRHPPTNLDYFLYGHWGEYVTITIGSYVSYMSIDTTNYVYMIKVEMRGFPLWKSRIIHDLLVLIVVYSLIKIKKYKHD